VFNFQNFILTTFEKAYETIDRNHNQISKTSMFITQQLDRHRVDIERRQEEQGLYSLEQATTSRFFRTPSYLAFLKTRLLILAPNK
jgi:hypothetical protein